MTAEYAVLVAAIAIGCIVAVAALTNVIGDLFHDPGLPSTPQQFAPPAARSAPRVPLTLSDCNAGRWRNYDVSSQADCEMLVTGRAP